VIHTFRHVKPLDAHEAMCRRLMLGDTQGRDWDWSHGFETGLHNVTIGCDTFDWEYDLKRLWIPRSRWTMMARQYINHTALNDCLDLIQEQFTNKRGRGIAVLRTNTVKSRMSGKRISRRWGSCMLNLSFRRNPVPTLGLHSRTTYFGYLAVLDITVAHAFAREISKRIGITPEEMQFVWTLDLAQFHGTRCSAWALGQPKIKAAMDRELPHRFDYSFKPETGNQPGFRKALDGYDKIVRADTKPTLYGDEKYASSLRIRKRFHTEVMGLSYAEQFVGGAAGKSRNAAFAPLPSISTSDLDFSVLTSNEVAEDFDDEDD
jgi:hypothetical protein